MVDKLHVVRDEYVFNDYASRFFFVLTVSYVLCYCFLLGVAVRSFARSRALFFIVACHYVHFTTSCTQATVAVGNKQKRRHSKALMK